MLATGTAGSESDGYDLNGSETSLSIYGGVYHLVYDDEDRLTSFTTPGNVVDTFTYNGLGLRVGKTDSTGTYTYLCDGTSPGSPVLSDGHAVYTPGLSERRGGVSSYYCFEQAGNLWTVDGAGKSQVSYQDNTGFGTVTAGTPAATPFQFGGANGCQTDKDTGLVLMGHRYYDTRIGRFISQDHAGAGMNWYAYADNNPVNEVDPAGLMSAPTTAGQWSINGGDQTDTNWIVGHEEQDAVSSFSTYAETIQLYLVERRNYHDGNGWQVYGAWPLASWMFAGGLLKPGPDGSKYRYDMGEQPKPDMHIYHNGDPKGHETGVNPSCETMS